MRDEPAPVPTGILILRAWLDGDPPTTFRARLTTTAGTQEAERSMIVAGSVEEACAAVRLWLSEFVHDADPRGDGAVTLPITEM